MTELFIKIKHNFPGIWNVIEHANSVFMRLRYPQLHSIAAKKLSSTKLHSLKWSIITEEDVPYLATFLQSIPHEELKYFNPHPFDIHTLRSMVKSRSFLMMKVTDADMIVGYHFLRCFFIGKAFHGLIVNPKFRGKKIGTYMWTIATEICHSSGLNMFATISKRNRSSFYSCHKGCNAIVTTHLDDDYLLVACYPPSISHIG